MTVDNFWAAVKALGLTQTTVATVFIDAGGLTHIVQDPNPMPSDVRAGFIRRLHESLGLDRASGSP